MSLQTESTEPRRSLRKPDSSGRLRIGNDWNAIRIIALSQSNPLKAVAELVENAIDAKAKNIVITRGKESGKAYLRVTDDGQGISCNEEGVPDFRRVATHVCDSIKGKLKAGGAQGIQGEFGIGLLSFWTVGEQLQMVSAGRDGKLYEMRMKKNHPGYTIERKRGLCHQGVDLKISPLLAGIRNFHGEKLQAYLASELRDRIRNSGATVKIIDRTARKSFLVEPKTYRGRHLHEFSKVQTEQGPLTMELYLNEEGAGNEVSLYRLGTRVLKNLTILEALARDPWTSGLFQGQIDVPFLELTPGTRDGLIHDEKLDLFYQHLQPIEDGLVRILEEHRKAKEEKASQEVLRSLQKAFREAMLALPPEDYDWFDVRKKIPKGEWGANGEGRKDMDLAEPTVKPQAMFESFIEPSDLMPEVESFPYLGPLFRVLISPSSQVIQVNTAKNFAAVCRDRQRKRIDQGLSFAWTILDGGGRIENAESEIITFHAPDEPGMTRIGVEVRQGEIVCKAEALITITETLIAKEKESDAQKPGFPNYTYQRATGELWRSRYDLEQNVIVINNGHRDFVYASRTQALKLRYICRLYGKELVLRNFPGFSPADLLERLVELSVYVEEQL